MVVMADSEDSRTTSKFFLVTSYCDFNRFASLHLSGLELLIRNPALKFKERVSFSMTSTVLLGVGVVLEGQSWLPWVTHALDL